MLTKKLESGIEARVYRDGRFMFDFSKWGPAPTVVIPGFRKPKIPFRSPKIVSQRENEAEKSAVLRAQTMNVHQACFTTAEKAVKNRSAMMGFPINAWNTEKSISFDVPPSYSDDTENIHALARNVLNNSYGVQRPTPLQRRVIELEVIDYSLQLLDKILKKESARILIQIIEALFFVSLSIS